MDNKKSFDNFWHTALAFVLFFLIILASVGSISYGVSAKEAIYTVAGILNFGWIYPVIYQIAKYIRKNNMGE